MIFVALTENKQRLFSSQHALAYGWIRKVNVEIKCYFMCFWVKGNTCVSI